jgi:hypothetical protein
LEIANYQMENVRSFQLDIDLAFLISISARATSRINFEGAVLTFSGKHSWNRFDKKIAQKNFQNCLLLLK